MGRNVHLVLSGMALILMLFFGVSMTGMLAMAAFASNLAFAFQNHFIIIPYRDMTDRQSAILRHQSRCIERILEGQLSEALADFAARAHGAPLAPGERPH